jgi:acetyltransferase-like isoleucine patch superfamily enzyme
MKTDWRDVLYTGFALFLAVGFSLALMQAASPLIERGFGRLYALAYGLGLLWSFGLVTFGYLRILIRVYPLREGVYALDHPQFTLWKHCTVIGELGRAALAFLNLPLSRVLYYRLSGARIGAHVMLGRTTLTDPLLTTLEDYAVVGDGSLLAAHAIAAGQFRLQRVTVRRGATVGVGTVVSPGGDIGENSIVAALSRLNNGVKVPPNELWDGIPARKVKAIEPRLHEPGE